MRYSKPGPCGSIGNALAAVVLVGGPCHGPLSSACATARRYSAALGLPGRAEREPATIVHRLLGRGLVNGRPGGRRAFPAKPMRGRAAQAGVLHGALGLVSTNSTSVQRA